MNCREAEKHIYLYTELSPREREETEKHVNTCAACRQLLEAVTTQRNIIIASSRVVSELPNASRTTRRIMDAVQQRRHKEASWFNRFAPRPSLKGLRYGMALVSLLLVTTFLSEYTREKQIAPYKAMPVAGHAELNSASFHATFIAGKENEKNANTFFYECVVNCFYSPDGDCEACRKRIKNLN